MSEELKFLCLCGCKAYGVPVTLDEKIISKIKSIAEERNDIDMEKINSYNPDDEFYHIKTPCELWICSGTKPDLEDLTFPKNHYRFDVDKPCNLNGLKIYNRFGDLTKSSFILKGECKCRGTGLPVKLK